MINFVHQSRLNGDVITITANSLSGSQNKVNSAVSVSVDIIEHGQSRPKCTRIGGSVRFGEGFGRIWQN